MRARTLQLTSRSRTALEHKCPASCVRPISTIFSSRQLRQTRCHAHGHDNGRDNFLHFKPEVPYARDTACTPTGTPQARARTHPHGRRPVDSDEVVNPLGGREARLPLLVVAEQHAPLNP